MANVRKRISELTALNSASLDTVIVGVDNGTTYKIELDVLADAVTSRVNILDRDRLQSLESVTSSFETKGRNIVSASAQITNLGFTTTSSFQSFSSSVHQRILDATNEQNLSNLATTGSNTFRGNQTISGSLIVSGSNIELKRNWPAVGTESHFLRLEPFTSSTGRYYDGLSVGVEHWDDGTGTYEHSLLIHSFDDDVVQNYGAELNVGPYRTHMRVYPSGSNGTLSNVSVQELSNGKTQALIYGDYVQIGAFSGQEILIGNNSASIIVSGSNMLFNTPLTSSYAISATSFNGTINATNGVISGSSQLTSSYDNRYVLSGSITQTTWDNIANKPNDIVSSSTQISALGFVTGAYANITEFNSLTQSFNIISGSVVNITNAVDVTQLNNTTASLNLFTQSANTSISNLNNATSSYETKGTGIISGSSQLNGATITNLTITNLTTINQTASVLYTSGSTTHGNSDSDTHSFTGSVRISGSVVVTGSISATSFSGIINSTNGVVSGSSQLTSSYDTRYTLSGSVQPLPSNLVSSSAQITAFGFISSSTTINTSSFATTGSNSFNGNQNITGSLVVSSVAVVVGALTIPSASVISLTSGSSISVDASGAITGSLTGSVFGIGDVVAFSASLNSRIISGSAVAGTISGSSQLTSSYDSRYSLSGSVLTSFSSSVDSRLDTLESSIISGSINYTQVLGNRRTGITSVGTSMVSGSITTTGNPVQIMVTGDANPIGGSGWTRLQIFRDGNGIGNIIQVENSSNLNVPYCLNVIDTPSAGTYTYSMRTVDSMSGTFDFGEFSGPLLTAVELKSNTQLPSGLISGSSQLPSGLISGSSQLTSSYDTRYTLSGSVQPLPSGLISGSSQLTSSYDTRYTLSGSVVSGTTPSGTISGSSQLTSSFDLRYLVTGSVTSSINALNTFSASENTKATTLGTYTSSLNIWTSSVATTGSNSFTGNQTITGSLTITTGSFFASQIVANTSSLYLTSGSNLYVQNNGLAEITGSLRVSGSTISLITATLQVGTGSGDEGGEILLAKSAINNSLTGSGITIDSYQNRLRIFEQGGNARGVHIDLTKTPEGVAGELMWKASGIVNAGTFVTLDNIKAQLPTSGTRGLSLATVAGTVTGYISGHYQGLAGSSAGTSSTTSLSTTATSSMFGWNFANQGDMSNYILRDDTNNRVYRFILIIGGGYNNNFISIERLH